MLVVHPSSQCDICARSFSEKTPPYVIPCGHIFCSPCFQDAPTKSCALCRRPYNSMKIKKLHVDYFLASSSSSKDTEMMLLRRLAEALVLGDGSYSPELAAAVEYMNRWLSLSSSDSSADFKGLKNIRALMEEYTFVQREYYRLHEELEALRAHLGASDAPLSESQDPVKKSELWEPQETSPDPPQASDFQSLIDMLRNTAWDPDLIRGAATQRSSTTSSAHSSREVSGDGHEPYYVVEGAEHQNYSLLEEEQLPTSPRITRVPAQYSGSLLDLRRQLARRQVSSESLAAQPHTQAAEDVVPRIVRFSQSTSSQSVVSDIEEEEEEEDSGEGTEEDEWGEESSQNAADASSHRQLTLHILLHGNTTPPPEEPSAPRLPTISLSPSASIASFSASSSRQSSLSGSHSGSRMSHAVSIITVDSNQSDNSWGTQSSIFSHMHGLRTFPQESSTRGSRSSSSSENRPILLHPQQQQIEVNLRRRPAQSARNRLRRDNDIPPLTTQGSETRRVPRSLPMLPTQDI